MKKIFAILLIAAASIAAFFILKTSGPAKPAGDYSAMAEKAARAVPEGAFAAFCINPSAMQGKIMARADTKELLEAIKSSQAIQKLWEAALKKIPECGDTAAQIAGMLPQKFGDVFSELEGTAENFSAAGFAAPGAGGLEKPDFLCAIFFDAEALRKRAAEVKIPQDSGVVKSSATLSSGGIADIYEIKGDAPFLVAVSNGMLAVASSRAVFEKFDSALANPPAKSGFDNPSYAKLARGAETSELRAFADFALMRKALKSGGENGVSEFLNGISALDAAAYFANCVSYEEQKVSVRLLFSESARKYCKAMAEMKIPEAGALFKTAPKDTCYALSAGNIFAIESATGPLPSHISGSPFYSALKGNLRQINAFAGSLKGISLFDPEAKGGAAPNYGGSLILNDLSKLTDDPAIAPFIEMLFSKSESGGSILFKPKAELPTEKSLPALLAKGSTLFFSNSGIPGAPGADAGTLADNPEYSKLRSMIGTGNFFEIFIDYSDYFKSFMEPLWGELRKMHEADPETAKYSDFMVSYNRALMKSMRSMKLGIGARAEGDVLTVDIATIAEHDLKPLTDFIKSETFANSAEFLLEYWESGTLPSAANEDEDEAAK